VRREEERGKRKMENGKWKGRVQFTAPSSSSRVGLLSHWHRLKNG